MSRNTPTRKTLARGGIALALGAGLAVAVPAIAQAHVGVTPDAVAPGSSELVTFGFGHGCDGSPTTALRITMPEGLTSAEPLFDANWDIAVERGDDDGLVDAVTFTARTPVPSDLRGTVGLQIGVADDASGTLVFPVEQQCEEGVNEWTDVAEAGQDPHDLDSPAPVVAVGETADAGAHGHDEDAADEAAPASDASGAVGVALGAGGLVAGVAALVVSILAFRRRA